LWHQDAASERRGALPVLKRPETPAHPGPAAV